MFLSRISRARQDDRGGALMGVIALVGVTGIIAAMVGTVSVGSLQTTNDVAASVEARGAADAGINAAELAVRTPGACPASGVITQTVAPAYSVRIQHDTGSGWVDGCPPVEATQVRFLATGSAERSTFGSGSTGDERVVEAVYQYIPQYVEVPDLDPAVYAYTIEGVLKTFILDTADITIAADIQIKTGNFVCSNGAQVNGDVVLADGYADLTACTITGSVHATDYVKMTNASVVREDVLAVGDGVAGTSDVVHVSAGSEVRGSIFSGGNVSILSSAASLVKGNVTAHRDTSTKVIVANGSTVEGNVLSSGMIQRNGAILGTESTGVEGLSAPPAPRVPDWTDIPWAVSSQADFEATTWYQQGFTNRVVWSGDCTVGSLDPRWVELQTYLTPTVIDATACVGGVRTLNNLSPDLALKTDIAFFADSFTFEKLYMASADTSVPRDLYFIVPDNTADHLPTCTGESGGIHITTEANIQPSVSAFVYTPCKILSERDGWRGQLYGGQVDFNQQAQMTYVPTSPPGIDFSASLPPVFVLDDAFLGDRLSIREVSSGG